MSVFIDKIVWNLTNINWEGSAMFAVIFLSVLALFRK